MTKSQKFKKEYAYELLEIAKGDFDTAEVLKNALKGRKENVCFIAQQVVEKSIKAVLCYLELPVPFTHNLDILIDKIPEKMHINETSSFNLLTEYATIRRYEEGVFELDRDDVESAVKMAKTALEWAVSIVK